MTLENIKEQILTKVWNWFFDCSSGLNINNQNKQLKRISNSHSFINEYQVKDNTLYLSLFTCCLNSQSLSSRKNKKYLNTQIINILNAATRKLKASAN